MPNALRHLTWFLGLMILAVPSFAANPAEMKASEFVAELEREGKLELVAQYAESKLQGLIADKEALSLMRHSLQVILSRRNWEALDHFPVVPMAHAASLRAALGGLGGGNNERVVAERFSGKLEDLMAGPCVEKGEEPKPVRAGFAELTEGHYIDAGMSACEIHQSLKLARLLNSLIRADGSEVRYQSMRARSAQKFFEMLIRSGHVVEMRNERTYANFIDFNYKKRAVIWPVWTDTGHKTVQGEPILVPVGHSQHAWRITGPLVDARVMFYLGTSGVGFFAQVNSRPAWTGQRSLYKVLSAEVGGESMILKAADFAGRYYRRIVFESAQYAQGMPANGYGYVGVCNDSNAALEAATRVDPRTGLISVTTYPLMRDIGLTKKRALRDGLDDLLAGLPKDSAAVGGRVSVLSRVLDMYPFDSLDDSALHDEGLRRQMKSIAAELR